MEARSLPTRQPTPSPTPPPTPPPSPPPSFPPTPEPTTPPTSSPTPPSVSPGKDRVVNCVNQDIVFVIEGKSKEIRCGTRFTPKLMKKKRKKQKVCNAKTNVGQKVKKICPEQCRRVCF